MRLTSWLSSWTRWLAAPRHGRKVRGQKRSRPFRVADFARTTAPLETLEPRLVLDGTLANDLAAFANLLRTNGVTLYGAAWDATTTAQRQLFGDGSQFLNFVEVTNPNRTFNTTATANSITTTSPTWIFSDGSRLTGTQSLEALSLQLSLAVPTIPDAIPQGFTPGLAPIATQTLLAGSPLLIPLDGFDPNNDNLTYTISLTNNTANLTATQRPRNGALQISVAGYGDILIDTFDDLTPRVTEHIKQLANNNFYDGVIFHRILNNFVIQGGDPTGTGSGGSTLGDFDDQFNVDLQHNRTGLISMAKTTDDTNDSQFFLTEGPQRHLDFNHSIFGLIVEGESVRDAISNTAANVSGVPTFTVTMQSVDVVADNENAVLMLKVPNGVTTGSATVRVRVTDPNGNFSEQTFQVNVQADVNLQGAPVLSNPFLDDIPLLRTLQNHPISFTARATDADGQTPLFLDQATLAGNNLAVPYTTNPANLSYSVVFNGANSGLTTVTPVSTFVGTERFTVATAVRASAVDYQVASIEVVASPTNLTLSAHNDPRHEQPNAEIADAANDGQADAFLVRLVDIVGTTRKAVEVSINGKVAQLADLDSVQTLIINGSNDTDTLTIDYANGTPFPAAGIQFNGNSQATGGKDRLILQNFTGDLLEYALTAARDGVLLNITPDGTRSLLTFTGVESISDTLTSTDRSVRFPIVGASAVLAVDTSAAGQLKLDFGTDLSLSFKAPTNAITVNGSEGNDSLTVDFANGIPIPVGKLQFNGLSQAGDGQDQLLLNNATAQSFEYALTGAQSGSFSAGNTNYINFTGLEAIDDSLTAAANNGMNRTVQYSADGQSAELSVESAVGNGKLKLQFGSNLTLSLSSPIKAPPSAGSSAPIGSLTVIGGAGADALTISYANGSPIAPGGVVFQGGAQPVAGANNRDQLVVTGTTAATILHTVTNATDGAIAVNGAAVITYNGTESVVDEVEATDRGFQFGANPDTVVLSDDGIDANGQSKLTYGAKEFLFANSTNSLVVNGGNGNDSLSAVGLDSSFSSDADLFLQGELGNDTIDTSEASRAFVMVGGIGSDILSGNDSDEVFEIEAGPDTINGNGGTDRIVATNLKGAVTLNNTLLSNTVVGGLGTDSISGIEEAVLSAGTLAAQINAKDFSGVVTLTGGNGNDSLTGTANADVINGGLGNDTIKAGSGNDSLSGGAGNDSINGELGDDFLSETTTGNGNVTVTATQIQGGTPLGTDSYASITAMMFTGGALANKIDTKLFLGNVTLLGGDGADTLISGNGNDSLQGQGGNDFLTGGAGNDILDGGSGDVDRLIETFDTNWLLTDTTLTGLGSDTLISFEQASLTGGAGGNTLDARGYTGNATLDGAAGADTIFAGTAASSLLGNAGNDLLIGNIGNDTLLGGNDTDTLFGNDGDDSLDAGGGNNDRVTGGNGLDKLNGGAGVGDWLIESSNAALITLTKATLSGITSDIDTVTGFEVVMLTAGDGDNTINASEFIGSVSLTGGGGNDALLAGTVASTLNGGTGDDTLTGGKANDSLVGGDDNDLILETGNGSITATLNVTTTVTQLVGGAVFGTDTYSGIETMRLTGGIGANRFDLKLFAGPVTLDGGLGNDTLTGSAVNDVLIGGDGLDSLAGLVGLDTVMGGGGNDVLKGGLDDDLMMGGDGNDSLFGGDGIGTDGLDTLMGEAGNDVLKGGLDNDLLMGGTGNDTLNGGEGNDTLDGGEGNDGLSGHRGDDSLMGGIGTDTLIGGDNNDTLLGGDDKDLMIGGSGADSVNGEDGVDTVTAGTGGTNPAPILDAADVVVDPVAEINNAMTFAAAWIGAVV